MGEKIERNEKQKGKPVVMRLFAGILALALIFVILLVANAFVGNPISAAMAKQEAQRYVDQHYGFLNLELEKAVYNFKFNEYIVKAKSFDNIDVHFRIYYRNGEIIRDDYESYVVAGFNTLERFSQEYSAQVSSLLIKGVSFPFPIEKVRIDYDKELYDQTSVVLEPGIPFDKDLPLKTELTVYTEMKERTVDNIAWILTDVYQVTKDNEYPIAEFGIFAENDGGLVMVHYVTAEDIESGELKERLQAALDYPEQHSISVMMRDSQK